MTSLEPSPSSPNAPHIIAHPATQIAILILAAVVAGLRLWTADFLDDAYITFQYARNIADGHGFIFTERYPTWGTTTPLFTLVLAFFGALGLPIPATAFALDVIALILQAVFVWMILDALDARPWAALAILLIQSAWSLPISLPGMEYGLYAALCLGAIAGIIRGSWVMAALCAALAAVTRPDGALIWLISAAAWLAHTRGKVKPALVIPAAGVIPSLWYGFALLAFRRMTPQTLDTRRFEATIWGSFWDYWRNNFFTPSEWVLIIIPAAVGFVLAARVNRRAMWLGIFFAAYTAMYSLVGLPALSTYFCPLSVTALAGVALAFVLGGRLIVEKYPMKSILPALLIYFSLLFVTLIGTIQMSNFARQFFFKYRTLTTKLDSYRGIGTWLAAATPPGTTFAANEIGALAWFSGRDLIEVGGLVNPEGLAHMKEDKTREIVTAARPDLIILPASFADGLFADDAGKQWLDQEYEALALVENDEGQTVGLWRRRDFEAGADWAARRDVLKQALDQFAKK